MNKESENNGEKNLLNTTSLRNQVYKYLQTEIEKKSLIPGKFMNLKKISQQLRISKTPLRDALIQLECNGFVTILPRRGVIVNKIEIKDIKQIFQLIGALESCVIDSVFKKLKDEQLSQMKKINSKLKGIIKNSKDDKLESVYYKLDLDFHNVFLDLSDNTALKDILVPLRQRLYDFLRLTYIKEYEIMNCKEHDKFIKFLSAGKKTKALKLLKDSHWSFDVKEQFIKNLYDNAIKS